MGWDMGWDMDRDIGPGTDKRGRAMMIDVESYRQNATDCLRQAESESAPEDKNILLNVALAWVRLAQQVQEVGTHGKPDEASETGEPEVKVKTADADETSDTDDKPATADAEPDPEKALVTH